MSSPITDVVLINTTKSETCPYGYTEVKTALGGASANLNKGRLLANHIYICYQRDPLASEVVTDIQVIYSDREVIPPGLIALQKSIKAAPIDLGKQIIGIRKSPKASSTSYIEDIILVAKKNSPLPQGYLQIPRPFADDLYICFKRSGPPSNGYGSSSSSGNLVAQQSFSSQQPTAQYNRSEYSSIGNDYEIIPPARPTPASNFSSLPPAVPGAVPGAAPYYQTAPHSQPPSYQTYTQSGGSLPPHAAPPQHPQATGVPAHSGMLVDGRPIVPPRTKRMEQTPSLKSAYVLLDSVPVIIDAPSVEAEHRRPITLTIQPAISGELFQKYDFRFEFERKVVEKNSARASPPDSSTAPSVVE